MPLRDLIRPTVRAIRWGGIVGASLPAAFVVWHFHNQPFPDAGASTFGLRAAAVMLAMGLAFVLDDPTEDTTGPAPVSILTRRALRIGLALPPVLLLWLVLRAYAGGAVGEEGIPAWPLTLEFLTFCAAGLAGAAAGARILSDRLGGLAGAGAIALSALVLAVFPWAFGLLTRIAGTPQHDAATPWWWMLAVVFALVWWRMSTPQGTRLVRLPRRSPPLAPRRPPLDPKRP